MDNIELSVISVIGQMLEEMLDSSARLRVLNYLAEKYAEVPVEWEKGEAGIGFQSTLPNTLGGTGQGVSVGWGAATY